MDPIPPLDYATLTQEKRGCLHGYLIVSDIVQFVATAVYVMDFFDFNWYMAAAGALFFSGPIWLAGVICLIIAGIWGGQGHARLIVISIVAHVISPISVLLVFARYNLK